MLVVIILCLVLLGDSTTGAETECGQPQRVHGALPKPEYRDVSSFAHNATIEYRCDVTHYLVDLTSWFRTCLNGKWDDVQFRCIAKTCPALTTPDNGQRVGYNHEVGTFAKFKCNDGYEMMGVAQLLCRTDMEWSPKDPPTCKPVRCRDNSYLANGRVFQETFRQEENTYGSTNSYSCNSGYDIKGPSIRTCQADKTWSGIQPICDMPRCREITAEHGEVEYMGDRARYSYAFITCDEGYGLGKDGVETVECQRSLHWDNTLRCYKTAKSWNPENSDIRDLKDEIVEHNDMYTIHCKWGYEMKQNQGSYLGGNTERTVSVSVKNLYGTLKYGENDAKTLSCVKKRCFQTEIKKMRNRKLIVQPNGAYIEHGRSFNLSCENGYEHSLKSDPILLCNSGKLEGRQPQCTPKRCFQTDINLIGNTSKVIVQPNKTYIEHGKSFKLSCENDYEHSLKSGLSLVCNYGKLHGELPQCTPKKCYKKNIRGTSNVNVRPKKKYIEHGRSFHLSCEDGFEHSLESDPDLLCNYGKLEGEKPDCTPKPCITPNIGNGKLTGSDNSEYSEATIISGQRVFASCEDNYFLYDNRKNNFTTERSMPITCELGDMTPIPSCRNASKCELADDPYSTYYYVYGDKIIGGNTISHEIEVRVVCENGTKMTFSSDVRTCWNGAWKPGNTVCKPDPCRVTKEKDRRFIKQNGREVTDDVVAHGQTVTVVCDDENVDKIGKAHGANSDIQCLKGKFDQMYHCIERCAIPDIPNANITRLNGTSTKELKHGEMITVTCPDGHILQSKYMPYDKYDNNEDQNSIFTCYNSTITGLSNKKCDISRDSTKKPRSSAPAEPNATAAAAASSTTNTTETSTGSDTTTVLYDKTESSNHENNGVLNCTIPASDEVQFITLSGGELIEGTKILHGRQIIAEKECKDYYEGYYDAFYNDGDDVEESSPTIRRVNKKVNCSQGSLSDYTLVCDDVETPDIADPIPDECRTIPNGKVTDNGQSFECNEGYVNADPLLYERYSCSCDREIPALVCNGRQAMCEPINCKLNSPIEQGMTLKYKGTFITASTIEAIDHGGSVIFDCEIGANEVAYEPKNRMFKCDRGNWIEHNRNGSWSLGNIGTFPKCRPAKCNCLHGGTCIRDETCVCTTFSTGAQCETPICHGGCQNGGSCTSPNKCRCPNGFSGNSCETKGCGAPVENVDERIYQIGATYTVTQDSCFHGNIPSFKGQVTCDNGHWSEEVICLPGTRYRIRVKTADSWGFGDGTDGEVYLYMFGSKGGSGKIILNGEFDAGGEDFTDDLFVDVGEISHIRLGVKSKSQYLDGWTPESVGIEDVSRREYYKFVHDLTEIDDTSIFLYPVASLDFCTPPADVRNLKPIYLAGDVLRLGPLNCAQGYEPQPSYTKCTEWGWTDNVVCVKRSTYRIRVKTVDYYEDPWSGTSQNLFIQINGSKAKMDWKQLSGNFGSGWITEQRIVMENIGQIQGIDLMASGKDKIHVIHERWKPEYVTIHVEDTDDLYVFRYNRPDYLFENATVIYPEGQCSRPFANYRRNVAANSSDILQQNPAKDETDCKIQCIENQGCKLAMYNTQSGYCRGYSYGTTYGRQNSNWNAYDLHSCYGRH